MYPEKLKVVDCKKYEMDGMKKADRALSYFWKNLKPSKENMHVLTSNYPELYVKYMF